MIKALSGTNSHAIDEALTRLISEFKAAHGELAIERFDGEEAEYDNLFGAVSTLPFLADKKLVIIKRLSANKSASDRIEELLNSCDDGVDVVLVEGKQDKRSLYYKTLKNLPGFTEHKDMDELGLARWVEAQVKTAGGTISHSDAVTLVNFVGPNQQRLGSEVAKLVLYNPQVSKNSIELLTNMTPRSSIFSLLDKAFAGDKKGALKVYDEQRQQNVEPYNILALIIWQLHALTLAKTAGKISSTELAAKSGLSPYTAAKSAKLAESRSLKDIKDLVSRVTQLEYAAKTSAVDIDDGLKNLIVSL